LKEKPGNHSQKQGMDGDLANYWKAYCYVEGNPCQRDPTRPIVTPKHEHSCNECQQFSRFYPNIFIMKRQRSGKVVSKADGSHRNVQARENQD
jgi:hypothetical protein